jgi:hypothetical protein
MTPTVSKYWLTQTRGGKTTRYQSGWKMSPEEASARGLTEADIVPGTTEERSDLGMQSAGLDGVRLTAMSGSFERSK